MSIKKLFSGKSRKPLLFLIDVCCFWIIDLLYFWATKQFDSSPDLDFGEYCINSVILFVAMFAMRLILRLYRNVWRYTNTQAYFHLVLAVQNFLHFELQGCLALYQKTLFAETPRGKKWWN